jgi:DNA (cytosine-5)-methyltransferase 1
VKGLVVDLFAGGGGASLGIELALGRPVDLAINHDATALAAHRANHPRTRHLTADVWEVRPVDAVGGEPVAVLWASPDCTHFSVAKGDVPRCANKRSLAWAVYRWAKAVRPATIFVENVREFQGWGPLGKDGKPDKRRAGKTFASWVGALERLGYSVEWRVLDASNFGAPTRRRRLFIVARADGAPIVWPDATHGPGLLPYRTAAECIDWAIPCPSIFERKRPLAPKTLWRIAEGLRRFVLEAPRPFLVKYHGTSTSADLAEPMPTQTSRDRFALCAPIVANVNHGRAEHRTRPADEPLSTVTASRRGHALVAPTLIQTGYGERKGQAARVPGLHKPLGTVIAGGAGGNGKHALVAAFLAQHFGGMVGYDPNRRPIGAVTSRDHHAAVAASLVKLRGDCTGASLEEPAPTITAGGMHVAEVRTLLRTTRGRGSRGRPATKLARRRAQGIVEIDGQEFQVADIGMRMLEPHELLRAQFGEHADRYDLSAARTKEAKVRLIGNSVAPHVAAALVRSNLIAPARAEARA